MTISSMGPVLLAATTSNTNQPGGIVGSLLHFHGPAAYALVGFLAFAEAALLVGFFIPGETAVVIGGVLAGLNQVNLLLIMLIVVVCAITGDSVGYEVGKRVGPWLLNHRPMKGNVGVAKTTVLLERFGGPAVFLGRFIAFARAVIPGLAGMSGVRYRTFLFYNAIGGLLWGVGYTLLGYVVGKSFETILKTVGMWSAIGIGSVVVVLFVGHHFLKRRRKSRGATTLTVSAEVVTSEVVTSEADRTEVPSPDDER
ncbi:MAG TPA: DedA family protein [Acidimicrobiales bacterium]|nr:DedA family protein [Acidimicrobiales bacterium]